MKDVVDVICNQLVIVTEGRVDRSELNADTRLWSLAGEFSVDLNSLEILALIASLETALRRPLPTQVELLPSATIGMMAAMISESIQAG